MNLGKIITRMLLISKIYGEVLNYSRLVDVVVNIMLYLVILLKPVCKRLSSWKYCGKRKRSPKEKRGAETSVMYSL